VRYPLGQPVRLSTTVRDVGGALVNAGALSLTVKKPDATTQTYASPTNDGTGLYHQDVPAADLTQLGAYQYVWTATGAGAGVSGPNGFTVFDPFELELLSLADAKEHLNILTTTYDAELQGFIDAVVPSIERHLGGPAVIRSVVETVEPVDCYRALPLTKRPFVSLTGITANGVTVSTSDVYATPGRVLRRRYGLPFVPYWQPPYVVTYKAGLDVAAPADVVLAGKIILGHLWETQRGRSGGRGPSANSEYGSINTVVPGFAFAIPNRALQLLNAYAPESGLA
jgi:hypothetical protein